MFTAFSLHRRACVAAAVRPIVTYGAKHRVMHVKAWHDVDVRNKGAKQVRASTGTCAQSTNDVAPD